MAPIVPNPKKMRSFRTEAAFEQWLRRNYARNRAVAADLQEGFGRAHARSVWS